MNLSNIKIDTLCEWDDLVTINFDIVYTSGKVDNVSIDIDKDGNIVGNNATMFFVNTRTESDYTEYLEFCNRLERFEGAFAKLFVCKAKAIAIKYEGLRGKLKDKHLYIPIYNDCKALRNEIITYNKVLPYARFTEREVEIKDKLVNLKKELCAKESKIGLFYNELSELNIKEKREINKIIVGLEVLKCS